MALIVILSWQISHTLLIIGLITLSCILLPIIRQHNMTESSLISQRLEVLLRWPAHSRNRWHPSLRWFLRILIITPCSRVSLTCHLRRLFRYSSISLILCCCSLLSSAMRGWEWFCGYTINLLNLFLPTYIFLYHLHFRLGEVVEILRLMHLII